MVAWPFDGATNISVDENSHNDDISYQDQGFSECKMSRHTKSIQINEFFWFGNLKWWCLSSLHPNQAHRSAFDIDWHNFDIGCFSAKRAGRKRLQSLGIQCLCLEGFNEAGTPNKHTIVTYTFLSQQWKLAGKMPSICSCNGSLKGASALGWKAKPLVESNPRGPRGSSWHRREIGLDRSRTSPSRVASASRKVILTLTKTQITSNNITFLTQPQPQQQQQNHTHGHKQPKK